MSGLDITGQIFGNLTAVRRTDRRGADGSVVWECVCECGKTTLVTTSNLKSGNTKSCGCIQSRQRRRKKLNKLQKRDGYYVGVASNTGDEFYFDECDYDAVSQHTWRIDKYGYVVTDIDGKVGVRLHRFLLSTDAEMIDHINGNTFDNRRSNLRVADAHTNQMNRRVGANSSTGHTGVIFRKNRGVYSASIKKDGKQYSLGCYKTIDEAIQARRKAEKELFGEYAFSSSRGCDK